MWIRSTKAFNTHLNRFYLWKPCFKPRHACAVKPEVLISWSLEIDYSRAPCLGADQKTRGLWERDWAFPLFLSSCERPLSLLHINQCFNETAPCANGYFDLKSWTQSLAVSISDIKTFIKQLVLLSCPYELLMYFWSFRKRPPSIILPWGRLWERIPVSDQL